MEWNWILEEYDDMVYVSDLNNYELLYVNRAGLDMFHLSREELFSGKKYLCYEIFHGRNTPCPFCTNNYLKDSGFYEWEHYNEQLGKTYLLKDRKVLWDGRESRIEFVFDVSKYKNKLDKQGKQQAAMLRSLPGGIARLDARDERTILWYGSEFLSIIGYTEEQFKEELQSQCLYVHPEDMEQAEARGEGNGAEQHHAGPDRDPVWKNPSLDHHVQLYGREGQRGWDTVLLQPGH